MILFVAGELKARQDVLDGFRAVAAKAVVEFGIPIGHERRLPVGQHKWRMKPSQARLRRRAQSCTSIADERAFAISASGAQAQAAAHLWHRRNPAGRPDHSLDGRSLLRRAIVDVPGLSPARRPGRFRTACSVVPAGLADRHPGRARRRAGAIGLRRGRRGWYPPPQGQRGRMVFPGQTPRSGGDPAGGGSAGSRHDSVRQVSAGRRLHRGRDLQRQQSELRNQLGNAEAKIRAGDRAHAQGRRLR